jgi:hypothetical protein
MLNGGNLTRNNKPLVRGAIMSSGSAIPTDNIDGEKGQAIYDAVVSKAGCSSQADTLACLRNLDFKVRFAGVPRQYPNGRLTSKDSP